jgi:ACS family hexuronate transporter-like MFS transporter
MDSGPAENRPTGISHWRWVICALLFFATTINYIDRQILSLLKPLLDEQLGWTNEQFGWVNALFQGAYAFSYLGFGIFIDRFGARIGYTVSIIAWSLAAAVHAAVNSVTGFAAARLALGAGEGGNFPAAIKCVSQWFPARERAFATTLFNSGANVGALLAPAIVPPLALAFSWHAPFLLAGLAGLVWVVFWLWLSADSPDKCRRVLAGELELIQGNNGGQVEQIRRLRWSEIIGLRQTWAYLIPQILTAPVWWFFLIWLPDFFKVTRGLDLKTMGLPLVVIYGLVTVVSISGGWAAKKLTALGWSTTKTRRMSLLVFACAVIPVVAVSLLPLWPAVLLIGLAGGAHQAWSATLYTTVSDVFPKAAVASLVGLGGFAGSIAGMIFPIVCGRILDVMGSSGYAFLFGWCSAAYLIAFAFNAVLCPRFEQIELRS